jgi:hypothetical protein
MTGGRPIVRNHVSRGQGSQGPVDPWIRLYSELYGNYVEFGA